MRKSNGGVVKMAASVFLFAAGASSLQAALISENFQGMTAGARPTQGTAGTLTFNSSPTSNTPTNTILVTSAATTPADPFGGAGNNSLYLGNTATSGLMYTFIGSTDTTGVNQGVLSFDLAGSRTGSVGSAFNRVFLGFDSLAGLDANNSLAATECLMQVGLRGDGKVAIYHAGAAGGASTLQTFALGENLHFDVTFDGGTGAGGTFSIQVTHLVAGVPTTVQLQTGTALNPVSTWNTLNGGAVTNARSVQFYDYGISGNTSSYTFADNVTLVPEPATLSIGLAAASGLLLSRRRSR